MSSIDIELETGEGGEAVSLEGEVLVVLSPRPFAPGAPVTFRAHLGDEGMALRGKTIGVRRGQDGRYHVRLRLLNLRRADREKLAVGFQRT